MKKYYVKNLKEEEKKEILENNEKLKNEIFEIIYEDNMEYQLELGEIFFGSKTFDYLEIKDYYSSFYLRIKDPIKLYENIDINNSDYLSIEDGEKYKTLYKEATKKYNNIQKCNCYSDNYYKNEEELEEILEKIVKILEKKLHSLEDITEDQIEEYFVEDINEIYQNCYILNKKDFILYEDIRTVKSYK